MNNDRLKKKLGDVADLIAGLAQLAENGDPSGLPTNMQNIAQVMTFFQQVERRGETDDDKKEILLSAVFHCLCNMNPSQMVMAAKNFAKHHGVEVQVEKIEISGEEQNAPSTETMQ